MVPPFLGAFITPYFASSLAIFLLRQFMLGLPRDLIDAGRIDGAGNWRLLWHVVVPLSKGSIVTVVLFAFLTSWTRLLPPDLHHQGRPLHALARAPAVPEPPLHGLQLPDGGVGRVLPAGSRGVRARPALLRAGHLPDRDQGLGRGPWTPRSATS